MGLNFCVLAEMMLNVSFDLLQSASNIRWFSFAVCWKVKKKTSLHHSDFYVFLTVSTSEMLHSVLHGNPMSSRYLSDACNISHPRMYIINVLRSLILCSRSEMKQKGEITVIQMVGMFFTDLGIGVIKPKLTVCWFLWEWMKHSLPVKYQGAFQKHLWALKSKSSSIFTCE